MVLVDWLDSMNGLDGWQSEETMRQQGIAKIKTVGWLMEDRGDQIVVCQNWNDMEGSLPYNGLLFIPRKSVKSIKELAVILEDAAGKPHDF